MSEAAIRNYQSAVVGSMTCDEWKRNPYECIGCRLVSQCEAGQKISQSLDAETTPASSQMSVQDRNKEESRTRFEKALQSGNPHKWYLENTGVSSMRTAYTALYRAKKRYPDVWEKYGKSEASKVTPQKHAKALAKPCKKTAKSSDYAAERTRKAKEAFLKALMSNDPVVWYLQNGSTATKENIKTVINSNRRKWPDVVAEAERIKASKKPVPPEVARAINDDEITRSRLLARSNELKARGKEILAEIQALNEELAQIQADEKKIQAVIEIF